MFPVISITDSIQLPSFSTLYAIAILIGLSVLVWDSRRYQMDRKLFWDSLFWVTLGGVIGQKVFYILFFAFPQFLADPIHTLTSGSGSMYYGTEIGGFIFLFTYTAFKKIKPYNFLDSLALCIAIAHGLGRTGCFAAGCCYGVHTDSIFGVHFPRVEGFVHPTQLYETAAMLILFGAMLFVRRKQFVSGTLFSMYLMGYGLWRFLVEFIRDDAYPFGPLHISPSQHFALLSLIAGLVLFYYLRKKDKVKAA